MILQALQAAAILEALVVEILAAVEQAEAGSLISIFNCFILTYKLKNPPITGRFLVLQSFAQFFLFRLLT
jgi:hypothetical protein